MNFTKKIDRAFQWAGEKMGGEALTTVTDEFKGLEVEMGLRHRGMERLHRSMNSYIKWLTSKAETAGNDKERGPPVGVLGRSMSAHGEEFDAQSEFGSCLIAMGRAHEQLSALQDSYATNATASWLESLERSLAAMKDYQNARKKLESRRLAYDASAIKVNKSKKEDFRLEEELRANKAKYDETCEDVYRRMIDIKEAEVDSIRDISSLLDAELEYHEQCTETLRRVRDNWPAALPSESGTERSRPAAKRSNTISNTRAPLSRQPSQAMLAESQTAELEPETPRKIPMRSVSHASLQSATSQQETPPHSTPQGLSESRRAAPNPPPVMMGMSNAANLRAQLRPVNIANRTAAGSSVFDDISSTTNSPERTDNGNERRRAPPPPPSRSKKPPPPVPARRT